MIKKSALYAATFGGPSDGDESGHVPGLVRQNVPLGRGGRPATILVADDDKSIRTVLTQALSRIGHHVRATGNGATLWKWVQEGAGDMVITDVMMPDGNGLDLLPKIRHIRPDLKILVMSAQNTLMTAVTATERGAFEYLPKPFDLGELTNCVTQALASQKTTSVAATSYANVAGRSGGDRPEDSAAAGGSMTEALPLAGRSPAMQEIYRIIARVVPSDINVMLHGEAGTGKELVARTIHGLSGGGPQNFVVLNLGGQSIAAVEELLVGPSADPHSGALFQSAGGTLFLDEVAELSAEAQAFVLNVLQRGGMLARGGAGFIPLNCRVIASSHRALGPLVESGKFRSDLLFRLDELPMTMPALRHRMEDIPELVAHFVDRYSAAGGVQRRFAPDALLAMEAHRWPGNVRELENFVKRLLVLYSQEDLTADIVVKELDALLRAAGQGQAGAQALSGWSRGSAPGTAFGAGAPGAPGSAAFHPGDSLSASTSSGRVIPVGSASHAAAGAPLPPGQAQVRPNQPTSLGAAVYDHLRSYFEAHDGALPPPGLYHRVLRELERPLFELSLEATKGNQIKTAELLGLNRNTVRKKLRDLEIDVVRGVGSPTAGYSRSD